MNHPLATRPRPDPARAGQESVWDYPRPPALEATSRRIRAQLGGTVLADSTRALRVLETSHPPTYYIPPEDVRTELLVPIEGGSFCEWKGMAAYSDAVIDGQRYSRVAWSYAEPTARFAKLAGYYAFYLPHLDAGFVDDERARPQPGSFYGGWVTRDLVGPFKGGPGTHGW